MYILATFIVKNILKILKVDPEQGEHHVICGPKMKHCAKRYSNWEKPLI